MFDYQFINEASKQYKALNEDTKRRVNAALDTISESPFRGGTLKNCKDAKMSTGVELVDTE